MHIMYKTLSVLLVSFTSFLLASDEGDSMWTEIYRAPYDPLDKELRRLLQVRCDEEITVRFHYGLSEWNGMNEAFRSPHSQLFKIDAPQNQTLPSYCQSQSDNTLDYLHIDFAVGQCAPTIQVDNNTRVYEHRVQISIPRVTIGGRVLQYGGRTSTIPIRCVYKNVDDKEAMFAQSQFHTVMRLTDEATHVETRTREHKIGQKAVVSFTKPKLVDSIAQLPPMRVLPIKCYSSAATRIPFLKDGCPEMRYTDKIRGAHTHTGNVELIGRGAPDSIGPMNVSFPIVFGEYELVTHAAQSSLIVHVTCQIIYCVIDAQTGVAGIPKCPPNNFCTLHADDEHRFTFFDIHDVRDKEQTISAGSIIVPAISSYANLSTIPRQCFDRCTQFQADSVRLHNGAIVFRRETSYALNIPIVFMIASGSFLIGCALVAGMWHVHARYERKKQKLGKRLEASPLASYHYDVVYKRETTTYVNNRRNCDEAKLLNANELTPCSNTSSDSGFANVNT